MKKTDKMESFSPSILCFLKAPQIGRVKTRLAAAIGPSSALRAYRRLAETQLGRMPTEFPLEIHYTPPDARGEMEDWLGPEHRFFAQADGDLGDRLSAAVDGAFSRGARSVICIGADCPALGRASLLAASDALRAGADLVFGPAADGGYYLVAMKEAETAIFENIPWSAPDTLTVSLATAERLGLRVQLLETRSDVDTIEDLRAAVAEGSLSGDILPPGDDSADGRNPTD